MLDVDVVHRVPVASVEHDDWCRDLRRYPLCSDPMPGSIYFLATVYGTMLGVCATCYVEVRACQPGAHMGKTVEVSPRVYEICANAFIREHASKILEQGANRGHLIFSDPFEELVLYWWRNEPDALAMRMSDLLAQLNLWDENATTVTLDKLVNSLRHWLTHSLQEDGVGWRDTTRSEIDAMCNRLLEDVGRYYDHPPRD